ncbi:hypothetical protein NQZ68_011885 [Dissostichus eleginoides]|nr:hypothetical protein NQZ68_011885 [Dissostichus eleginoides]
MDGPVDKSQICWKIQKSKSRSRNVPPLQCRRDLISRPVLSFRAEAQRQEVFSRTSFNRLQRHGGCTVRTGNPGFNWWNHEGSPGLFHCRRSRLKGTEREEEK